MYIIQVGGMHDRQQHPAGWNNIIGWNHILQWHTRNLFSPKLWTCWLHYVWINAYSYMSLYWKANHAST